jgi:hypothetical protein
MSLVCTCKTVYLQFFLIRSYCRRVGMIVEDPYLTFTVIKTMKVYVGKHNRVLNYGLRIQGR